MSDTKFKIVVTYTDRYEFDCAHNATKLNASIEHALREIRNRLKYNDEDMSMAEQDLLENLRTILSEHYVEG